MWIESHPDLENHPKLLKLCQLTGWDKDTALGRLHRFWWWCTRYAEDGDLRKHGISTINSFFQLPLDSDCLFTAHFIDRRPYLNVHDWWDFYGRFLKIKYRHNVDKLTRIEQECKKRIKTRNRHVKDMSNTSALQRDVPNGRTDRPNGTGRTDGTDVEKDARESASLEAPPPAPKIKSYEEAEENEICGPPKDFSKLLNKSKHQPITTD